MPTAAQNEWMTTVLAVKAGALPVPAYPSAEQGKSARAAEQTRLHKEAEYKRTHHSFQTEQTAADAPITARVEVQPTPATRTAPIPHEQTQEEYNAFALKQLENAKRTQTGQAVPPHRVAASPAKATPAAQTPPRNEPEAEGGSAPVSPDVPSIFQNPDKEKHFLDQLDGWHNSGVRTLQQNGAPVETRHIVEAVMSQLAHGIGAIRTALKGDGTELQELRTNGGSSGRRWADLADERLTKGVRELNKSEADHAPGSLWLCYDHLIWAAFYHGSAVSFLAQHNKALLRKLDIEIAAIKGVRDGCLTTLKTLAPLTGAVGVFLVGTLSEALQAYDDHAEGKPVNLGRAAGSILLGVLLDRCGDRLFRALHSKIGPWVAARLEPLVMKAKGTALFERFGHWLLNAADVKNLEQVKAVLEGRSTNRAAVDEAYALLRRYLVETKAAERCAERVTQGLIAGSRAALEAAIGAIYAKIAGQKGKSLKETVEETLKELRDGTWLTHEGTAKALEQLLERAAHGL